MAIDFSLGEFNTDTVVAALIPLFHLSLPSISLPFSSLLIYLFILTFVSLSGRFSLYADPPAGLSSGGVTLRYLLPQIQQPDLCDSGLTQP